MTCPDVAQDACQALSFLKRCPNSTPCVLPVLQTSSRFTRNAKFTAKELLDTAATFKASGAGGFVLLCCGTHAEFDVQVSHRMLSALEAAYGWPGESQLTVVKDLNSGDPVAFPCRLAKQ